MKLGRWLQLAAATHGFALRAQPLGFAGAQPRRPLTARAANYDEDGWRTRSTATSPDEDAIVDVAGRGRAHVALVCAAKER